MAFYLWRWKSQKKRHLAHDIEAKLPKVSKSVISKSLKVGRRNLYNKATIQSQKDLELKDQILKVLETDPAYGHRRIALELKVGKKRVRRVMKLYGIKPYKRKARWRKPKDYGNPTTNFPNLIKGSCPIKPRVVYAGDFTYLRWNNGFIYLATFLDIYTREIVGWSVSTKHTEDFVIEAFIDAVIKNGKPEISHTDQGSEYRSEEYTSLMSELGIKISMSAKGSPWENAYQESFYDNFKTDLGLEFERFQTIGEFVEAIHTTIQKYNTKRIHTKLKMPPAKFKQKFLNLSV